MEHEGPSPWVTWPLTLAVVAAVVVLPSTVGAAGDHEYTLLALVAVLAVYVADPVHVLAHELGHLAAAVVLRLRPRALHLYGTRMSLRPGALTSTATHAVVVDVRAGDRALPLRMVLLHAAGPAVNVALTWLACSVWSDPQHPEFVRTAAGGAGALGLVTILVNILPAKLADGSANDGRAVLRWAFASQTMFDRRGHSDRLRSTTRLVPGERTARDELRREIVASPPPRAGAAATELIRSYASGTREDRTRGLWQEATLLTRVGRRPGVGAEDVRYCCSSVAVVLALECVRGIVEAERRPTDDEVATVKDLAEAGIAALPTEPEAVHALAFARYLEGRSAETSRLLIGLPAEDGPPRVIARALAIRGLAEIELDDRDQAEQLVAQAERLDPVQYVVHLARAQLNATR